MKLAGRVTARTDHQLPAAARRRTSLLPLLFVDNTAAADPEIMQALSDKYELRARRRAVRGRRDRDLRHQPDTHTWVRCGPDQPVPNRGGPFRGRQTQHLVGRWIPTTKVQGIRPFKRMGREKEKEAAMPRRQQSRSPRFRHGRSSGATSSGPKRNPNHKAFRIKARVRCGNPSRPARVSSEQALTAPRKNAAERTSRTRNPITGDVPMSTKTKPSAKPSGKPAAKPKPTPSAQKPAANLPVPMPTTPVPAPAPTKPKPESKPEKKAVQQPQQYIGPFAAIARSVIERIGDMAKAIGPYETLVAVLTMTGLVSLIFARDPLIWPICLLVGLGLSAPLVSRLLRKRP
jgi:hypothetical protein